MLDRKKILFVHPLGYRAAAADRDISRVVNIMPPIGLAGLAAYLERRGIGADIIDCHARPDSEGLIREHLLTHRPAWLGLSCTTSSFLDGVRIAEMARSVLPGIKTVFGGAHVSALKERVLTEYPAVDFTVIGEGEATLTELIECEGASPASVKGLIHRDGSAGACFTGYREPGLVLDSLPFPAYEKLAGYPEAYRLPIFNYPRAPNTSCISSRGCPYSCSYCDRSVFRRGFRYNGAEYLYEHLRYLKERFGIRHINFYDDNFTCDRARVKKFSALMSDRPLGMTFNCAVRPELIDQDLLREMKQAGCWMISLGIESGDASLLAQHRQNTDLDKLAGKIRLIKQAGIRTKGLLMIGLPGETEASIQRSMDYVFSLPIDDFNLAKFTPFPGSPIYSKIRDLGEFDEDWEKMDCMHFVFIAKGMTAQRLEELFRRFYRTHFQRPKVLWGYITMLWRSPDSWLRFLRNLPDFIRFTRTTTRIMDVPSPDPSRTGA